MEDTLMRKMNQIEMRTINGGTTYYRCRICDYTNKSYAKVYWHVIETHELPIVGLILAFVL